MGFAWNKTCAEVNCAQYGACCRSERMYDEGNYTISWFCRAGCQNPVSVDIRAEFVQGYTCPAVRTGCDNHTGACCYLVSMHPSGVVRSCIDGLSRKVCSNRPSYVSFHVDRTCESINNCNTTTFGACLSPPVPNAVDKDHWLCIAGDSEAMCFARFQIPYWFPQHAPGYSCKGFNSSLAINNTILRQRGACWSFNETAGARQCNNHMMRHVCMAKAGFLGFSAAKACNQTSTVSGNHSLAIM
jgi:hypothetical protein